MIALSTTDNDWFHFLRKRPEVSLVNFWTPTDWGVKALSHGDHWYFVLKGIEPRKIGGGGRFIEYKVMRASKAWERYGIGNGSATFQEMVEWINRHIKKNSSANKPSLDPEIGCVILDNCVYLPDHMQMTAEEFGLSFSRHIVKFKTFYESPLQFTQTLLEPDKPFEKLDEFTPSNEEDGRKRALASIVMRRGQPLFRKALIQAYEGKCSVTGCDASDTLEAAHITPYMGDHTNTLQNGLLLRADIHTLFDLGKIAISPSDFRVILHRDLREGHYKLLHGKMISMPKDKSVWPSTAALDKHKKDSGL